MMDCQTGFLRSFGVWTVPVCPLRSEGSSPLRHFFAPRTCIRQVRSDPDHDAVMRIGSKAPGGGPILSIGINATFEYGFPPPRIAIRRSAEKLARAPNGVECMLVSVSPFSPLDVRGRPPVFRPS